MKAYEEPESEEKSKLNIADIVALLSVAAVFVLACFNAGYFSKIGGRFVDLFSIPDLLGSSIPILEYFFAVYFVYSTAIFVIIFLPGRALASMRERLDDYISSLESRSNRYQIVFVGLLFLAPGIASVILEQRSFTLAFLIPALAQGFWLYALWLDVKLDKPQARKRLIISAALSIVVFSYTSGRLWAISDINDEANGSSFVMANGQCHDRILLRANSSGYLLYNFGMKQSEFRSKDDVRTIFQGRSCT